MPIQLSVPQVTLIIETKQAIDGINGVVKAVQDLGREITSISFGDIDKQISDIQSKIDSFKNAIKTLNDEMKTIPTITIPTITTPEGFKTVVDDIVDSFNRIVKVKDEIPKIWMPIQALGSVVSRFSKKLKEPRKMMGEFIGRLIELRKQVINIQPDIVRLTEQLKELAAVWERALVAFTAAQIVKNLPKVEMTVDKFGVTVEDVSKQIKMMSDELTRLTGTVQAMGATKLAGQSTVVRRALDKVSNSTNRLEKTFRKLDEEVDKKIEEFSLFDEILKHTSKVLSMVSGASQHLEKDMIHLSAQLAMAKGSLSVYQDMWSELNSIYAKTLLTTGLTSDSFNVLARQLFATNADVKDLSGSFQRMSADLMEFGKLAGFMKIEAPIVSQIIAISKMTGIAARDMTQHMVRLAGAVSDMGATFLTWQDAADIMKTIPELAATMSKAMDRRFVMKLSANVSDLARTFVKQLGMSSSAATAMALNITKKFAEMTGDIRSFLGGLTAELSDDTMLMIEMLTRVGVSGTDAFRMLSDTSGESMKRMLNSMVQLIKLTRGTYLEFRTSAMIARLFGSEWLTAAQQAAAGNRELFDTMMNVRIGSQDLLKAQMKLQEVYTNILPVIADMLQGIMALFKEFLLGMGIIDSTQGGITSLRNAMKEVIDVLKPMARSLGLVAGALARIVAIVALPVRAFVKFVNIINNTILSIKFLGDETKRFLTTLTSMAAAIFSVVFYLKGVKMLFKAVSSAIMQGFIKLLQNLGFISGETAAVIGAKFGLNFLKGAGKLLGRFSVIIYGIAVIIEEVFAPNGPVWKGILRAVVKLGTAALGAFLGSFLGPLGTIVGGLLGTFVGDWMADIILPVEKKMDELEERAEEVNRGIEFGNPHNPGPPVTANDKQMGMLIDQQELIANELSQIKTGIRTLAKTERVNVNISAKGDIDDVVKTKVERQLVAAGM